MQDSGLITESSDKGPIIKITINGYEQKYTLDEVSQMPELLYADLYAVSYAATFVIGNQESGDHMCNARQCI